MHKHTEAVISNRDKRRNEKLAAINQLNGVVGDLFELIGCNRPFGNPKSRITAAVFDRSKPVPDIAIAQVTNSSTLTETVIDITVKEPRDKGGLLNATDARNTIATIIQVSSTQAHVNGLNAFTLIPSERDGRQALEVTFTNNNNSLPRVTANLAKARDILLQEKDLSKALKQITEAAQTSSHVERSQSSSVSGIRTH